MTSIRELEQIKQAIKTLESCEEHTTEPFRIVLITLKQKIKELEKKI